tara:strand:- start:26 stop:550 length:525 start_codon:yes stop_codon:yes gene_type:complete
MKWIKASERNPNKDGNYYIKKGEERFITTYDNGIRFGISGEIEWLDESETPTPEVGKGMEEVLQKHLSKSHYVTPLLNFEKEFVYKAISEWAAIQCEAKDAEYAKKEHSLRNELQGLLSKQAASMLNKFSEKDAEIKELREWIELALNHFDCLTMSDYQRETICNLKQALNKKP